MCMDLDKETFYKERFAQEFLDDLTLEQQQTRNHTIRARRLY